MCPVKISNLRDLNSHSFSTMLSLLLLFEILWTIVLQASLSMGFSRQEYRSALPFPSPGELPDPGIKPESPALQVDSLTLITQ